MHRDVHQHILLMEQGHINLPVVLEDLLLIDSASIQLVLLEPASIQLLMLEAIISLLNLPFQD